MIPVYRRLSISDIPSAPSWVGYMFNIVNTFAEQVIQLFTKNLIIGENVQGMKYTTQFATSATYAAGDFQSIIYNYTGGGQPNCLLIGSINESTGAVILTPVSITNWSLNINVDPPQIVINYIAGLAVSKRYDIVIVAL